MLCIVICGGVGWGNPLVCALCRDDVGLPATDEDAAAAAGVARDALDDTWTAV